MLKTGISSKRIWIWTVALLALAPTGLSAQEHDHGSEAEPTTASAPRVIEGRTPAHILPAEAAGILLLEGREQLEHPEEIVDRMQLADGDLVADLGCGNGYYTLRLAPRVGPRGVVFAVDIQQGMLDQMEQRAKEAGVKNIYPILSLENDPLLPAGKIDWVLMVDVYHEFADPRPMLAKIRECLAPDGRVALLEYRAEQDPATIPFPIPADHKMSVEQVKKEWLPAGFELVETLEFLPAQHYFIFKKAE